MKTKTVATEKRIIDSSANANIEFSQQCSTHQTHSIRTVFKIIKKDKNMNKKIKMRTYRTESTPVSLKTEACKLKESNDWYRKKHSR